MRPGPTVAHRTPPARRTATQANPSTTRPDRCWRSPAGQSGGPAGGWSSRAARRAGTGDCARRARPSPPRRWQWRWPGAGRSTSSSKSAARCTCHTASKAARFTPSAAKLAQPWRVHRDGHGGRAHARHGNGHRAPQLIAVQEGRLEAQQQGCHRRQADPGRPLRRARRLTPAFGAGLGQEAVRPPCGRHDQQRVARPAEHQRAVAPAGPITLDVQAARAKRPCPAAPRRSAKRRAVGRRRRRQPPRRPRRSSPAGPGGYGPLLPSRVQQHQQAQGHGQQRRVAQVRHADLHAHQRNPRNGPGEVDPGIPLLRPRATRPSAAQADPCQGPGRGGNRGRLEHRDPLRRMHWHPVRVQPQGVAQDHGHLGHQAAGEGITGGALAKGVADQSR